MTLDIFSLIMAVISYLRKTMVILILIDRMDFVTKVLFDKLSKIK